MCYFKKLITSKAFKRRKMDVLTTICSVFDCFFGSVIMYRFLILSSFISEHSYAFSMPVEQGLTVNHSKTLNDIFTYSVGGTIKDILAEVVFKFWYPSF